MGSACNGVGRCQGDTAFKVLSDAALSWAFRHLDHPPTAASPLAVALSGGADSVALLFVAHACWPSGVIAFHVNHGLQDAAADFQSVCERLCDALGLPLLTRKVVIRQSRGESLEAQARCARYLALSEMAAVSASPAVWLAQHADDQAETVLLALTRGSGLPGLSAMPDVALKHKVVFGRPFLHVRSQLLRSLVEIQRLAYVDDPSNRDLRFTRNKLRHKVLPELAQHFPAVVSTLSRTARHAAQAQQLLNELAEQDLEAVGLPPSISSLRVFSRHRLANVLRFWLARQGGSPSAAQLDELVKQVLACSTRGHRIDIKVGAGRVLSTGQRLFFDPQCQSL